MLFPNPHTPPRLSSSCSDVSENGTASETGPQPLDLLYPMNCKLHKKLAHYWAQALNKQQQWMCEQKSAGIIISAVSISIPHAKN